MLAYFGYPGADEDDAEHAVRAGLALVGSEAKLSASVDAHLQIRIGIASGIVVIREELAAGQRNGTNCRQARLPLLPTA